MNVVPLFCADPLRDGDAQCLAGAFSLTLTPNRPVDGYWLELGAERLSLETTGRQGAVYAEFVQGGARYRREHGGGRGQPIAKAIGLRKRPSPPYVVDATAGLGRDAFVLASLGCRVTLLERSPIVAALLSDALKRAAVCDATKDIVARMEFVHTNAIDWLGTLQKERRPDVILVDPMFSDKERRSAAKKDMVAFQDVVGGDDLDAAVLLKTAMQAAVERVVVKRPRLGACIDGVPPCARLIGKSTRFDLYLTRAMRYDPLSG